MSCRRVSGFTAGSVVDQPARPQLEPVEPRFEAGLRAGDVDRDQVGAVLSEALAAGYLSMEEFEARTDQALTARTIGELNALQQDLPISRPAHRAPAAEPSPGAEDEARRGLRAHVASYVGTMGLLMAIWLVVGITTGAWYFWPIWPMLGWGIGVVSHVVPVLTGRGSSCSRPSLSPAP